MLRLGARMSCEPSVVLDEGQGKRVGCFAHENASLESVFSPLDNKYILPSVRSSSHAGLLVISGRAKLSDRRAVGQH